MNYKYPHCKIVHMTQMGLLEYGFDKSMFLFTSKTQVNEKSSNQWKLVL